MAKIEALTVGQRDAAEEMRKGMVTQNLGLEAAFSSANNRLDEMSNVQSQMRSEAAGIAQAMTEFMVSLPAVVNKAICDKGSAGASAEVLVEDTAGNLSPKHKQSRGKGGRGSPGGRGGRSGGA